MKKYIFFIISILFCLNLNIFLSAMIINRGINIEDISPEMLQEMLIRVVNKDNKYLLASDIRPEFKNAKLVSKNFYENIKKIEEKLKKRDGIPCTVLTKSNGTIDLIFLNDKKDKIEGSFFYRKKYHNTIDEHGYERSYEFDNLEEFLNYKKYLERNEWYSYYNSAKIIESLFGLYILHFLTCINIEDYRCLEDIEDFFVEFSYINSYWLNFTLIAPLIVIPLKLLCLDYMASDYKIKDSTCLYLTKKDYDSSLEKDKIIKFFFNNLLDPDLKILRVEEIFRSKTEMDSLLVLQKDRLLNARLELLN